MSITKVLLNYYSRKRPGTCMCVCSARGKILYYVGGRAAA